MRRIAVAAAASAALAGVVSCSDPPEAEQPAPATTVRNADATDARLRVAGSPASTDWMRSYVIPGFVEEQRARGVTVTVTFEDVADPAGRLGVGGADVVDLPGAQLGELTAAGRVRPLTEVAGPAVDEWDGWGQIPEAVQDVGRVGRVRHGVPTGVDGRVLFFNKKLFAQVGLPPDWQPQSWDEVVEAAETLRRLSTVTPIHLNAGTALGEATSIDAVLPLLAAAGAPLHGDGKWQGDTGAVSDVLAVYERVYGTGLGDNALQQPARPAQAFAGNRLGILLADDHLWRVGLAAVPDRDATVGWAKIPAFRKGGGVRGQDFVSLSTGAVRVLNPDSEFPAQAWELVRFMGSAEAVRAELAADVRLTQRADVNEEVLRRDPLLSFVAREVLPLTTFPPGLVQYPRVSAALQRATAEVVAGRSVPVAAQAYQEELVGIVGADNVASG